MRRFKISKRKKHKSIEKKSEPEIPMCKHNGYNNIATRRENIAKAVMKKWA